ncbi:MAG: Helix-turn-helix domain [Chloroflexota bacterium]
MRPVRYGLPMDDVAVGRLLRAIRIGRGWRQVDVAARAGVSGSQISRVETGGADDLRLADLRSIASVLEVRLSLSARWRGGDSDRLVNANHVRLQRRVLELLPREWVVAAEVTFSVYGERGAIDVLAWHPDAAALLVIEVKTELADPGRLLAQVDRYRRLGPAVAQERGWSRPASVGVWVVIAESSMNRRRLASAGPLIATGLPDGFRAVRSWLRSPHGSLRALSFSPYSRAGGVGGATTAVRRVSPRRRAGASSRGSPYSRGA